VPEGPSILILREQLAMFIGRTVRDAAGRGTLDLQRLRSRRLRDVRSWGKQLILEFDGLNLRIHLLLFGRCLIHRQDGSDAIPSAQATVSLRFEGGGGLDVGAASARWIEGDLQAAYDWSADVLSPQWDPEAADDRAALRHVRQRQAGDMEVGEYVRAEGPFDVLDLQILGGIHGMLFARIVHEDVDPPEGGDREIDEFACDIRIAQIAGEQRAAHAFLLDAAPRLFRIGDFLQIAHDHIRALAREVQRDRAADAAVAAGHDRDSSFQLARPPVVGTDRLRLRIHPRLFPGLVRLGLRRLVGASLVALFCMVVHLRCPPSVDSMCSGRSLT